MSNAVPPEHLVTVVPGDVAVVLLVRAGLDEYRRAHRGEHRRTDEVLVAMTHAALRWKETTGPGQSRAPVSASGAELEWVTVSEAAALTGKSPRSIRRAITDGELRSVGRAGKTYVIRRNDLAAYAQIGDG
ncbi:MAG: helix-turn-helix domain-containing protein [Acidimicrobiia bacterium]|nr:helix-turn-helix domain-containing protein [Acidimicrobiia bacterium]